MSKDAGNVLDQVGHTLQYGWTPEHILNRSKFNANIVKELGTILKRYPTSRGILTMPTKKWDTHIYLSEDLYRQIERLAAENERSLTGQIRFMLTQQLSSKESGNAE